MTKIQILPIYEFGEKSLESYKWYCSMSWCPSQCYYRKPVGDKNYLLYLRWRHQDPWQGSIFENAYNEPSIHNENVVWHHSLFVERDLEFIDKQVKEAKKAILAIWEEMFGVPIKLKLKNLRKKKKKHDGSRRRRHSGF